MALYICRHGEREDWVNSVWQQDADFPYDPPLSHDGMRHAQELGRRMARRVNEAGPSGRIDIIFVSPFWRALQTAAVANRWIKAPIYVMEELAAHITKKNSEFFETPELEYNSLPAKMLEFNFPGLKCQGPVTIPKFPETVHGLSERARRAAAFISGEYCVKKGLNVLVVTHRQTAAHMVEGLCGARHGADTMTGYCALIKLEVTGRTGSWELRYSHPGEKERHAMSYNVKKFFKTSGPVKIRYRGEKGNEARMEAQRRAMSRGGYAPDLGSVGVPPGLGPGPGAPGRDDREREDDSSSTYGAPSQSAASSALYPGAASSSTGTGSSSLAYGPGRPGAGPEGGIHRSSMKSGARSPRLRGGWGASYGAY
eukprot:tig00000882_g5259.t1